MFFRPLAFILPLQFGNQFIQFYCNRGSTQSIYCQAQKLTFEETILPSSLKF